jgi:hypothetical protein
LASLARDPYLENDRTNQNPISKLNLVLTGSGLLFFLTGSYMFLETSSGLTFPGQYFFILGLVLSCIAMITMFVKLDF